ncbi:MAG: hypothetical protein AAGC70_11425 [Pseudomonadota bacterium]
MVPKINATLCLVIAALATATYAVTAALVLPALNSDAGWGFLVWESMANGADLNHYAAPNPENIAQNRIEFHTIWSPGQYLMPGVFELAGFTSGLAVVITVTIASAVGLMGWYFLYVAFGFPSVSAAVAVAIISLTRYFSLPFTIYNGGEVLYFAVAPWFALGVWLAKDFRIIQVPAVLAGMTILFFAKLTGIVYAVSILSASVIVPGRSLFGWRTIRQGLIAGSTIVIFGTVFYWLWQSRGWNAASAGETNFAALPAQIAFSISAIFSSSFSMGDLASYVFLHPSRPVLKTLDAFNFAVSSVAIVVLVFVWLRLGAQFERYKYFVAITALMFTGFLALLLVRGGDVGWGERHFRVISLLVFIGIVHVALNMHWRMVRLGLACLAGIFALYGVASFVNRANTNLERALDGRQLRHLIADKSAIEFLINVDKVDENGVPPVVLVPSPEIGLILKSARVISIHADFVAKEKLMETSYSGTVPRLYVLLQKKLVENGKAEVMLRTFQDYEYDKWKTTNLGAFTVFSQEK